MAIIGSRLTEGPPVGSGCPVHDDLILGGRCLTHAAGLVPNGKCVPHMGSHAQRCESGYAVADKLCIETGMKCATAPPPPTPPAALLA